MDNSKMLKVAKSAALFVLFNLPITYQLTNSVLRNTWDVVTQCPTTTGKLVHAAVFALTNYLLMKGDKLSRDEKIKKALANGLVFLVLSSSQAFSLVGGIAGPMVAIGGCPSLAGIILHGLVYGLTVRVLLKL
jgi:hypothetical protein